MKYIYAALLLHSSEKPIDEESMKKVLTAAGIKTDEARIKALVTSLAEVNIDDALKTAVIAAPAPTTPAAAAPEDAKKKEEKPKEEKKEEEALEGLGSLFG